MVRERDVDVKTVMPEVSASETSRRNVSSTHVARKMNSYVRLSNVFVTLLHSVVDCDSSRPQFQG